MLDSDVKALADFSGLRVETSTGDIPITQDTISKWQDNWKMCFELLRAFHTSVHYLISRDGSVIRLVREDDTVLPPRTATFEVPPALASLANRVVQVGLVGAGTILNDSKSNTDDGYTEPQMHALGWLIELIYWKNGRFSDVGTWSMTDICQVESSPKALQKVKQCVSPGFDWSRFRNEKGAFPSENFERMLNGFSLLNSMLVGTK
jgi:N-acetyl-anhydromuramyl-L-alanine amidase AmpD